MMEIIKEFVTTLVSTIILITAVELILPDNSIKKYSKFILGTMLIGVILTPIIKFVTHGEESLTRTIISYENKQVKKRSEIKEVNSVKEKAFEENFEKNIDNILKREFKKHEFSSEVDCEVNFENMEFNIKNIVVYVRGGGDVKKIKKVEEVIIGKETEMETGREYEDVREYLAKELNISKEKIKMLDEGGV